MAASTEQELLDQVARQLKEEGYEVYIQPNKPLRPGFLADFMPDAIALRSDGNLVIEVMRQSPNAPTKAASIAALLDQQDGWKLRIVWFSPASGQEELRVQNASAIEARIDEVRRLVENGHLEPALLMAWATFEALARLTLTVRFSRPQSPGRLVEVLAADGYLTPTEADSLRTLATKRNNLIHGGLDVQATRAELEFFLSVLTTLLKATSDDEGNST